MARTIRFFLFSVLVMTFAFHGAANAASPRKIVAGTELISDIVRDLLDGKVEIVTLIPAGSCPGHHDMRAADMAFFTQAELVVIHGWQRDFPGIPEAMAAARLPESALKLVPGRNSLLVPENQIAASKEVAACLSGLKGVDAAALQTRLRARVARIEKLAAESRSALAPYKGTPALSAAMQAEFARWLGLHVVAEYGRAEDMSPGKMMALADTGKKAGVLIVVDNLQSGAEAGVPLAGELRAAHVGFSNFPGFSPEAPTYERLLLLNVRLLRDALAERLNNAS